MARPRLVVTGLLALAGLGVLAGCTNPLTRDARIRFAPTPELDTLHQRNVDIANALAIQEDTNWRMFNQDLGRAFYVDRPSRLTREPIIQP